MQRFITSLLLPTAVLVLSGCVVLPATPAQPPGPSATDQAFEALGRRYLDESATLYPVRATSLGDHRYDAVLDDVSAAGRDRRLAFARRYLGEIAAIDRAAMSAANQVDARLLAHALEGEVWTLAELDEWRWNPLLYTALAGDALYSLMARDFAPLPDRLRSATARLEALPTLLAQARDALDPARVPRVYAETALKQNPGIAGLITDLIVPQASALPAADRARLEQAASRATIALSQHQVWLEKRLVAAAQGEFRFGAERFDRQLRFALDSSLTRGEIRTRAEAALAHTRAEMYEVARQVLREKPGAPALPDAPTPDQQQTAIQAALELVAAERPVRSAVFDYARGTVADARQFVVDRDLITLYDDPLEIVPMPVFNRGVALAYCDTPGPLDRGQKTFYTISPIPDDWSAAQADSFLREYNNRAVHELTIHEAMPGHYVQFTHANRYPSTLRAVFSSGTFAEGWAVYAERMMADAGYLGADPLMRLVQLKWYLRSIANAILDQAVHVDGISREEAMRLLMHDAFQEEREAAGKWTRAQLSAGQLSTYFVGAEEHFALREEARARWAAQFSLKAYHDAVLSFGTPPVRYVRALLFGLPIED